MRRRVAVRRVAWLATATALLIGGCSAARRPEAPRPPAPPAGVEPSVTVVTAEVSFATNLFHWVDNLAGTSLGKTRDTYRRHWRQWVGPLDDRDRAALIGFRRARRWRPDGPPRFDPGSGCFPDTSQRLSARARLSAAAMEATSLEDLHLRASRLLPPDDAASLRLALEHFEAPFRRALWSRSAYLQTFREDLESFLSSASTDRLLGELVRFTGARPERVGPARISLVAVLEEGPTHAEANGRHLLLEIRPGDRGRDQTQVIFHELAHYLMGSVPAEERARLAGDLLSSGPRGALVWSLLQEGLPTALGQGVAQARLAPAAFRPDSLWYHRPDVDRYAHAVYPAVRRGLASGQHLAELAPEALLDAVPVSGVSAAPARHLGSAALAAPGSRYAALRRLREAVEEGGPYEVNLDHRDSERFLARFGCVPLVVLATEDDWPRLRLPHDDRAALPPDVLPLSPGAAGVVVPARRAGGAAALFLIAADADALAAVVDAVKSMKRWPRSTVEVIG